ncbi:MAG: ATP-grasp domain-containing protein [Candidatus Kapaibacterium sp.]
MEILHIEEKLTIVTQPVNVGIYDFDFNLFFSCRHPTSFPQPATCVLRLGAIVDYSALVTRMRELGLEVVNNPDAHLRASELREWYPLIADLTARTICRRTFPPVDEVEQELGWPVFVKGSRQTSGHNPQLSIARSREEYMQLQHRYRSDPILYWQDVAVREFLNLQSVGGAVPGKVAPSMEFRTFWWFGTCVGWGRYWYQVPYYQAVDIVKGLEIAEEVARRVSVPFLVVDIARREDGRWIVIECNDAQEAGYAGAAPQVIWRNVLRQLE